MLLKRLQSSLLAGLLLDLVVLGRIPVKKTFINIKLCAKLAVYFCNVGVLYAEGYLARWQC